MIPLLVPQFSVLSFPECNKGVLLLTMRDNVSSFPVWEEVPPGCLVNRATYESMSFLPSKSFNMEILALLR